MIIVLTAMIPLAVPMLVGKILNKRKSILSKVNESHISIIKQLLQGFDVIKSNQVEKNIIALYDKRNVEREKRKLSLKWMEDFSEILSMNATFLAISVVLGSGAYLIMQGDMTIGALIAVVQLLNSILQPLNRLSVRIGAIKSMKDIVSKINEFLEEKEQASNGLVIQQLKKSISLQQVSYAYGDKSVIDAVDLEIELGKKYAIIGLTGSGKSTLLKLIAGMYTDYQGFIYYDENELSNVKLECLYQQMTFIHQDVFLFDDNLLNNITLYKDYSSEAIQDAIHKARLAGLIEHEEYQIRNAGEFGKELSGGERQRVSIARGIIRNTPIYLLDEATSALDPETSKSIYNTLLALDSATIIAITHNWDNTLLEQFDEVILMHNGRILKKTSPHEFATDNLELREIVGV